MNWNFGNATRPSSLPARTITTTWSSTKLDRSSEPPNGSTRSLPRSGSGTCIGGSRSDPSGDPEADIAPRHNDVVTASALQATLELPGHAPPTAQLVEVAIDAAGGG